MPDGPGGKADGAKSQGDAGKAPPSRKKENVDAVEGFGDDGNLQKLLNQPPQEFGKCPFLKSFLSTITYAQLFDDCRPGQLCRFFHQLLALWNDIQP